MSLLRKCAEARAPCGERSQNANILKPLIGPLLSTR